MIQNQKKRSLVSYEKMSDELMAIFNEKYPRGYNDYLSDLVKYDKPDGTSFYAVTIETDDAIYLVRIQVKVDSLDDLGKWLEGDDDMGGNSNSDSDDGGEILDDNISEFSNGEDDNQ